MKATFKLTSNQLGILQNKSKLCAYLNSSLTKSFFKLTSDKLTLFQRGSAGAFCINIPVQSNVSNNIYYSVDYNKWNNALLKFSSYNEVEVSISKNVLALAVPGTLDIINLSILTYDTDSSEAYLIDNFISDTYASIFSSDLKLSLTEDVLDNFDLADSLFSSQGRVNSIGLSKDEVIYSDRSVVLKIKSSNHLPEELFGNLSSDDYIFIHSFFLKLFKLLVKTNSEVYFSNDYETIYWEDDHSKLIISSDSRDIALPTNDQWEMIKPSSDAASFTTDIYSLQEGLNFFTGFYEETAWKPIIFEASDSGVKLYYRHPTTEISKSINNITSSAKGYFMISSETINKILSKISFKFNSDIPVTVFYDEDSPGVYCKVSCDTAEYEFVLSKLVDVLQD